MAVLKNRAKMSTSTTGTGTITLGSAEDGYQTFADAGVANADVVRYIIEDGNNFEIGTGTYTSSGTTLSRTVSESSNSDAAINLSGSATVFIGATAEDIPALYADNTSNSATAPIATGNDSVSLGSDANSSGTDSIAIMNGNASGLNSLAAVIATNTTTYGAQGSGSISIGTLSKATALGGTAVGYAATSTHVAASAFGTLATTTASNQIALGGSGITARISGAYNLPTSDGTNGQVLTTSGSGVVTFADAAGGADLYSENYTSGTKPATTGTNAVAIGKGSSAAGTEAIAMVDGTADSQDSFAVGGIVQSAIGGYAIGKSAQVYSQYGLALGKSSLVTAATDGTAVGVSSVAGANSAVAFAKSRASGADSLAGAIANNTTSYGASGANSIAIGKLAKATGDESVCISNTSTASGSNAAVLGGSSGTASGSGSVALGGSSNVADGAFSTAKGYYGNANGIRLKHATGVYPNQQGAYYVLGYTTSDATPIALNTSVWTPSSTNQIVLPNNSAFFFSGTCIAREQAADGTDVGAWEFKGAIRREANAGTTTLIKSTIDEFNVPTGWALALSADTTNGCLKIEATGVASTDIRWVATVQTSEVIYT